MVQWELHSLSLYTTLKVHILLGFSPYFLSSKQSCFAELTLLFKLLFLGKTLLILGLQC